MMVLPPPSPGPERKKSLGFDPLKLRLALLGMIIVGIFVGLFSRLWFLQVLNASEFTAIARENSVRRVQSEPPRGRILDRKHKVLVANKNSLAVSLERELLDQPGKKRQVLARLSRELGTNVEKVLRKKLKEGTVSPYKPVAVATDVSERVADYIDEHRDRFPGVVVEELPSRDVLAGSVAPHVLGYTGEITRDQLKSEDFKGAKPAYAPGDIVGREGVELTFDRYLRGHPEIERVVVDSSGDVVASALVQEEQSGADLILAIDSRIQRLAQNALDDGILTARSLYEAPTGGVVVMDPTNGNVLAMASHPSYNARTLADGISYKEEKTLGMKSVNDPSDDKTLNRPLRIALAPGSSFKPVTAGAALTTGVASPGEYISCPGTIILPPGIGGFPFPNWTDSDLGAMSLVEALEQSCNTVFYELGWRLEREFSTNDYGDGTERFQKYARGSGFGAETGINLPSEEEGLVPDTAWCHEQYEATKELDTPTCPDGWLPGYTINMAIGQGDLLVTPLQMAVAFGAIANGGDVMKPRIATALTRSAVEDQGVDVEEDFRPRVLHKLGLDDEELSVIRSGLQAVVTSGTAKTAFAGFPLGAYPVAGKTGTAQLGESDQSNAWFVSYAPADNPRYVIATYVEHAGHGGESAAPIARQIYEGIFEGDARTEVTLGQDNSR